MLFMEKLILAFGSSSKALSSSTAYVPLSSRFICTCGLIGLISGDFEEWRIILLSIHELTFVFPIWIFFCILSSVYPPNQAFPMAA